MTDRRLIVYAVLAAAISVSAFDYGFNRDMQTARLRDHNEIIHDAGLAPNRYRILIPFAVEPAVAVVSLAIGDLEAFRLVYGVVYAFGLWAMALTLFAYVEPWFGEEPALVGVLLIACTLPITLRHHIYAPWSIAEPCFLTAALIAVRLRRDLWIVPLTLAASLNRETGLLVPIALLIHGAFERPRWNQRVKLALACVAMSLAIFVILRAWRGNAPAVVSVGDVWAMNTSRQGLKTFIPAIALILGCTGWVLAVRGFSRAPRFVRRSMWLAAVYLPLYLVYGYWYEVRLLMTLYPVLTPTLLAGIYQPRTPTSSS